MKAWLNPKWRVWIFIAAVNAAWMIGAWFGLDRENWLWVIPIALSINMILVTYDQLLNLAPRDFRPLAGQDSWGLLKIVNEQSEKLQVPAPDVFLLPYSSAQIFTYARSKKSARIYVSEGLLDLLNARELRAVICYQLLGIGANVAHLNYWIGGVLDLAWRIGKSLERIFALAFGWTPKLANYFIKPWLGFMRLLLFTPGDFEHLDYETALKIDHPSDLAKALWKMHAYAHTKPWPEPWVFAHMCMVSPLPESKWSSVLRPQPNLKGRIKSLTGSALL